MKRIVFLKRHSKNHRLFTRLDYEWRRLSRDNLLALAWKLLKKILSIILGILFLPLSLILHIAGFRRVTVFTDRIGHLAIEPDCLIKEQSLGLIPKRKWLILAPPGRVANEHLLKYWESHFYIVRNKAACFLIASMSRWWLLRYDINHYARTFGKAQAAYRIYADWGERPPLLRLTENDEIWGNKMLEQLGIPRDSWFVCVHAREHGFSPIDEELHSHRNSSIKNTIPAMLEITRRGGWVIRIGDPTMQPLTPMHQIVDYAHHVLKSQRLDIILCARARFILGNTSGIALVGSVFGVRCAISNMIPMADIWYGVHDISIPKLLWSNVESRYLNIAETMAYPISSYRYAQLYRDAGLKVVENSPEDIVDLVLEMLARLEGTFSTDAADIRRAQRFRELMPETSASYFSHAGVGCYFLRKYFAEYSSEPLTPETDAGGDHS